MDLRFWLSFKKFRQKEQDTREKNLFLRSQLNEIIKKGLNFPVKSFNL